MDGLLFHRCTIQRVSVTYDSQGAPVESWSTISTGVPCLIQRMRGMSEFASRGKVYLPSHNGYFRAGTNIQDGDKIMDVSPGNPGDQYIVRRVDSMPPASNQIESMLELIEGFR